MDYRGTDIGGMVMNTDNNKVIGEIYETQNYGIFKHASWNRDVPEMRVKKITKSIKRFGYKLSPIAVNENFEIIDGQGRLEALTRLGLPVHYYTMLGAGKDECIAFNQYNTPWSIGDYISSYANLGIEDYEFLQKLLNEYRNIQQSVIIYAVTGKDNANKEIKSGTFECTKENWLESDRLLQKCEKVRDYINKASGNTKMIYMALIFALKHCDVDEERMFTVITRDVGSIERVGTIQEALESLSEIYNRRFRKGEPIYLYPEYDRFQRAKYPWYGKKWGDRKITEG